MSLPDPGLSPKLCFASRTTQQRTDYLTVRKSILSSMAAKELLYSKQPDGVKNLCLEQRLKQENKMDAFHPPQIYILFFLHVFFYST